MKTTYSFIILALVTLTGQAQTIPNAGFENWTNFGSYSEPNSWASFNMFTSPVATCEQGTPGFAGASYLKLTSKTTGTSVTPGIAKSGTSFLQNIPGFNYSLRPANLIGEHQYLPSVGDYGAILVFLTKWNTSLAKRDTIAEGISILFTPTSGWTGFSVPLTYKSGAFPDSATIFFESSAGMTPIAGSALYIDDISFSGSVPTGINEISYNEIVFSVYPNRATDFINIKNANNMIIDGVVVIDAAGRIVLEQKETPSKINIQSLEHGMYQLLIRSEGKNYSSKFIKE